MMNAAAEAVERASAISVYVNKVMPMQGHLLLSTDALETFLDAGDQGLEDPERIFNMGTSFNTGAFRQHRCAVGSSWRCKRRRLQRCFIIKLLASCLPHRHPRAFRRQHGSACRSITAC